MYSVEQLQRKIYARPTVYSGLDCPKCGAETMVIGTTRQLGYLHRRRKCSEEQCGHRFSTHELVVAHRET